MELHDSPTWVDVGIISGCLQRVEIHRLDKGDSHEGEVFELVCYSHGKGSLVQVADTIRTFVGVKSVQFEEHEVP
jgi:hypothetical protein